MGSRGCWIIFSLMIFYLLNIIILVRHFSHISANDPTVKLLYASSMNRQMNLTKYKPSTSPHKNLNDSRAVFLSKLVANRSLFCSSEYYSLSVNPLFEMNHTYILPQHRLKSQRTNLIPAIYFYSGSFTPIHAGHLTLLKQAKQYIDSLEKYEFLAAYLSPMYSGYVREKLDAEEMIGVGHRLAMISLAIETLDWVMLDLFEMFQTCSMRPLSILAALMSRVRSQLPNGDKIVVFSLVPQGSSEYEIPPMEFSQPRFEPLHAVIGPSIDENVIDRRSKSDNVQGYDEEQRNDLNVNLPSKR